MPVEYLKDGDIKFVGLNSRDNPSALPAGHLSQSQNFRLDRGVATVRKGLQRKTIGALIGSIVKNKAFVSSTGGVTRVTSLLHGMVLGETVAVTASNIHYSGTFVITAVSTDWFEYTVSPATTPASGTLDYTKKMIYGCASMQTSTGQEVMILVVNNGLYTYNPQTELLSSKVNFPSGETIVTTEGCSVVQGTDKVFISRGFSKRPLVWDMNVTVIAMPAAGVGHEFPSCKSILYYANRFIVTGKYHAETNVLRNNDTISVSNFLDYEHFNALDAFTVNNGSNDSIVGVCPWTLNEFLVFMRNSIFYINVGLGRYASGDALATDTFTKTLVNDLGCSAERTAVQANGGVVFLSDNGVYFLQPQSVGANDAVRLLTIADPLSAPIDDVIKRINRNYSSRAVATYWNNRYYLAVPLDDSSDNNAVLVYNFILSSWESVDVYPTGFDVANFLIAKKDNQRRLYAIDSEQGVFLMEELDHDEYGNSVGLPLLPFYLPDTLLPLAFQSHDIIASMTTRMYNFNGIGEKRFSTAEVEVVSDAGSQVQTSAIIDNPDAISVIDTYGFPAQEDSTRRNPIRRLGSGIQLFFQSINLRPSVRSAYVYAVQKLKNNQSRK